MYFIHVSNIKTQSSPETNFISLMYLNSVYCKFNAPPIPPSYRNIVFVWSQFDGGKIDNRTIGLWYPPKPRRAKLEIIGRRLSSSGS